MSQYLPPQYEHTQLNEFILWTYTAWPAIDSVLHQFQSNRTAKRNIPTQIEYDYKYATWMDVQ